MSPEGETLAETTPDEPVITVDVDLADVERAKLSYPRTLPST